MQKNIILNAESKKVRQTDGKMSLYSTVSYVLEGPQLEDPKILDDLHGFTTKFEV